MAHCVNPSALPRGEMPIKDIYADVLVCCQGDCRAEHEHGGVQVLHGLLRRNRPGVEAVAEQHNDQNTKKRHERARTTQMMRLQPSG